MESIYDFRVMDAEGKEVSLEEYRGKVLLIVNTATECGFTPQYKGLQELYERYREQGFEILDFPCNQFLKQSPLNADGIKSFCELKYHTTFRLMAKVDVNGKDEAPLYRYLKSKKGGVLFSAIKWNFTKFLISRTGEVVERYSPTTAPKKIATDIEKLL